MQWSHGLIDANIEPDSLSANLGRPGRSGMSNPIPSNGSTASSESGRLWRSDGLAFTAHRDAGEPGVWHVWPPLNPAPAWLRPDQLMIGEARSRTVVVINQIGTFDAL